MSLAVLLAGSDLGSSGGCYNLYTACHHIMLIEWYLLQYWTNPSHLNNSRLATRSTFFSSVYFPRVVFSRCYIMSGDSFQTASNFPNVLESDPIRKVWPIPVHILHGHPANFSAASGFWGPPAAKGNRAAHPPLPMLGFRKPH